MVVNSTLQWTKSGYKWLQNFFHNYQKNINFFLYITYIGHFFYNMFLKDARAVSKYIRRLDVMDTLALAILLK